MTTKEINDTLSLIFMVCTDRPTRSAQLQFIKDRVAAISDPQVRDHVNQLLTKL